MALHECLFTALLLYSYLVYCEIVLCSDCEKLKSHPSFINCVVRCGPTTVLFYLLNKPKIIIIYLFIFFGVNLPIPIRHDQII